MSNSGIERSLRSGSGRKHGTKADAKQSDHRKRKKENERSARKTVNLSTRPDEFIAPATPFPLTRATVDSSLHGSGFSLPTFPWNSSDDPRKTWSPRSPGQTPRGKQGTQERPTLGRGRKEFSEIIKELVGSVNDASNEQIEEVIQQLRVLINSCGNLKDAMQGYQRQAAMARRQGREFEQRADDFDAQANILQKLGDGSVAQWKSAIETLESELDSRVESVDQGRIEQAQISVGAKTFGSATLALQEAIDDLTRQGEKPDAEATEKQRADKDQNLLTLRSAPAAKFGMESPDEKIDRKIAEHAAQLEQLQSQQEQLKRLVQSKQAVLEKWRAAKTESQASERSGSQSTRAMSPEASASNM